MATQQYLAHYIEFFLLGKQWKRINFMLKSDKKKYILLYNLKKMNMPKVITNKCFRFENKIKVELFYYCGLEQKKIIEIITSTILKSLLMDLNHRFN